MFTNEVKLKNSKASKEFYEFIIDAKCSLKCCVVISALDEKQRPYSSPYMLHVQQTHPFKNKA